MNNTEILTVNKTQWQALWKCIWSYSPYPERVEEQTVPAVRSLCTFCGEAKSPLPQHVEGAQTWAKDSSKNDTDSIKNDLLN